MTEPLSGGRRAAGWAALAAGLSALAAGVALAIHSGQPPEDAGALPVAVAAPQSVTPSGKPAPTAKARNEKKPTQKAPTPPAWATPTRVAIGQLKVDAPVQAVGVRADRSLNVPDDGARLGWWIGSATPGSPRGTVVIAGHVDTAEDGPGALFRLENLKLGATIQVRAGDRVVAYKAVARRSYPKQRLPKELFAANTAPRLALVTCGGSFHDGVYSHNVIVYAEPVSSRV
ncbi:class F sortase [Actinoplanes sp. Pm04-4]|uniref:Class F sortase n=1 Tax=Paractinoplanes pyxinae TaxID=2997416 RepID=A0ABT4AUR1_9ACTN|nr:class F sortase [Actinoplanes pyxinae]MCY1137083.1 class F sortase [Actinoplanes pyxinae]